MKFYTPLLLTVLLVSACTPATLPPDTAVTSPPVEEPASTQPITDDKPAMPFSPLPSDTKLERGEVFLDESGLIIRESFPPQIALTLSGTLPTPCHQLRVRVDSPNAENKIHVEAYSVTDPNMVCAQILKSLSETIELGTFPSGHYTVWLNGEQVGEFAS